MGPFAKVIDGDSVNSRTGVSTEYSPGPNREHISISDRSGVDLAREFLEMEDPSSKPLAANSEPYIYTRAGAKEGEVKEASLSVKKERGEVVSEFRVTFHGNSFSQREIRKNGWELTPDQDGEIIVKLSGANTLTEDDMETVSHVMNSNKVHDPREAAQLLIRLAAQISNRADETTIRGIEISGTSKLGGLIKDPLNIAQVNWTNLTVEDCRFRDIEFGAGQMTNVVFRRCHFEKNCDAGKLRGENVAFEASTLKGLDGLGKSEIQGLFVDADHSDLKRMDLGDFVSKERTEVVTDEEGKERKQYAKGTLARYLQEQAQAYEATADFSEALRILKEVRTKIYGSTYKTGMQIVEDSNENARIHSMLRLISRGSFFFSRDREIGGSRLFHELKANALEDTLSLKSGKEVVVKIEKGRGLAVKRTHSFARILRPNRVMVAEIDTSAPRRPLEHDDWEKMKAHDAFDKIINLQREEKAKKEAESAETGGTDDERESVAV